MRVLVTGASGFVGAEACRALRAAGHDVRRALRGTVSTDSGWDDVRVGPLDESTHWAPALDGVDAVLHLAARVHMLHDTATDPLAAYRQVNTAGTERLAREAVRAGVRRFVYASTIKVNGEHTTDTPFRADDAPHPQDPYGISKHEAELALRRVAAGSALTVAIVRPPLVYGPGVKGNFRSLLRWVDRRLPLPLGAVHNRRSLVGLQNLASLLRCCVESPRVTAGSTATYLVSDGDDVSTPQLLHRVARALGRKIWLPPVPVAALRTVGTMLGRRAMAERLADSLQVDVGPTLSALGWAPVSSMQEELARTAAWYRSVG